MLETMRQHSRSAVIYVLFGVIIAVFVINFGPGSRGCSDGGQTSAYAAQVEHFTIAEQDFRFAFISFGGPQFPPALAKQRRIKEFILAKLVERELLAHAAEKLGFRVSASEAEDHLGEGNMVLFGSERPIDSYAFKDGQFDYERFRQMVQNHLGVTVSRLVEIERRELLAKKMRDLLRVGSVANVDEVRQEFDRRGNQVNLEFVRFSSRPYQGHHEASDAEIKAYVTAHEADLKKEFEGRSFLYKKADKQGRIRHILINVAKDAKADATKAHEAEANAAAAELKKGSSFADVARRLSQDELTRARGGLIGWRKKGTTGFSPVLDDKVFSTARGQVIGPERTERGFEIVLVEEFREGDIPFAAAATELAAEMIERESALAQARAQAELLVAQLQKGGKWEKVVPAISQTDANDALSRRPVRKETGLFSQQGDMIPEIGLSPGISKRAFALKQGEAEGPFDVLDDVVVIHVKEKKVPDAADFEKNRAALVDEYERTKSAEVLTEWSKQTCEAAHKAGRIRINDNLLSYDGPKSPVPAKAAFNPCSEL